MQLVDSMNYFWHLLFIIVANCNCYGHEEQDQICFKVSQVGSQCGCLFNNNEVCLTLPHSSERGVCNPGQCDLFKTTVDLTEIGNLQQHQQELKRQQDEQRQQLLQVMKLLQSQGLPGQNLQIARNLQAQQATLGTCHKV